MVSAIVPTYNAERFIRGCIEDLEAQTIADRLEIVVVETGSLEKEGTVVKEFQRRYDNILYVHTNEREDSHSAINRGIRASRGAYVTLACTDDRHRPDALELMSRALDEHREVGLVYADSLITHTENETFDSSSATRRFDWPDYSLGALLATTFFGPQPMWRKEVHHRAGFFNPYYLIAGDYDLWVRIARHYGAIHLRETLGLFLERADSNSGIDNAAASARESAQLLSFHRRQIRMAEVYPSLGSHSGDPHALAAALWDFANLCAMAPYPDFELAAKTYEQAIHLSGLHPEFTQNLHTMLANNLGVLMYCTSDKQRAGKMLEKAIALPSARSNLEMKSRLDQSGESALPLHFSMAELKHPVVADARRARGLRLDESGALVRSPEHEQVFWQVYGIYSGVSISEEEKARAVARKPRAQVARPSA